jgi:heme A synthase
MGLSTMIMQATRSKPGESVVGCSGKKLSTLLLHPSVVVAMVLMLGGWLPWLAAALLFDEQPRCPEARLES